MMNRRTLLWGLGLLLAAPVAFEAQQAGKVYRVLLFFVGDRQATPYAVLLRERLASRDTARDTRSCLRSALYTAIWRPAEANGREPEENGAGGQGCLAAQPETHARAGGAIPRPTAPVRRRPDVPPPA